MQEELIKDIKTLLNDLNLPEDSGVREIIIAIGSMSKALERFRDIAIAADKRADESENKLKLINEKVGIIINNIEVGNNEWRKKYLNEVP